MSIRSHQNVLKMRRNHALKGQVATNNGVNGAKILKRHCLTNIVYYVIMNKLTRTQVPKIHDY